MALISDGARISALCGVFQYHNRLYIDIRRLIERTEAFHLNQEEAEMVQRYCALNEKERKCLAMVVQMFLEE